MNDLSVATKSKSTQAHNKNAQRRTFIHFKRLWSHQGYDPLAFPCFVKTRVMAIVGLLSSWSCPQACVTCRYDCRGDKPTTSPWPMSPQNMGKQVDQNPGHFTPLWNEPHGGFAVKPAQWPSMERMGFNVPNWHYGYWIIPGRVNNEQIVEYKYNVWILCSTLILKKASEKA